MPNKPWKWSYLSISNSVIVDVWEWSNNFIPHFMINVIYLSMLGSKFIHVSKRGTRCIISCWSIGFNCWHFRLFSFFWCNGFSTWPGGCFHDIGKLPAICKYRCKKSTIGRTNKHVSSMRATYWEWNVMHANAPGNYEAVICPFLLRS